MSKNEQAGGRVSRKPVVQLVGGQAIAVETNATPAAGESMGGKRDYTPSPALHATPKHAPAAASPRSAFTTYGLIRVLADH